MCKNFFPDSNSNSNSRRTNNSADVEQRMRQGIEAYKKQNYFVADTAFSEVIKLQPSFALAYALLGASQLQQGHKQDALVKFQTAENLLRQQGQANSDTYQKIQRLIEIAKR